MKALEIKDLRKSFRSNFLIRVYPILKGITLNAERGEIYGFLGPNGAGKTTTIKCVLGLIFPDAGEIRINEKPSTSLEIRKILGFLPENPYFYDYLTATELLHFTAALFSLPRAEIARRSAELLQLVGLSAQRGLKLRKFSKGMLQRLGIAQSLIHDPEILILDEPFSGLDPIGRKDLRDIILGLKERGKTIFFSSHILQDMEMMVDRVGIILDGTMIREGKLSELISHSVHYNEIVCTGLSAVDLDALGAGYTLKDGQGILRAGDEAEISAIVGRILARQGKVLAVTPVKMTLEDIFIKELQAMRGIE